MSARIILALFAMLLLAGCASQDKTVTIGEPGQKGVYKGSIDTAKGVAGQATDQQKQGDKDLGGG